jgi:predicted Na+-dependent transporter
MVKLRHYINLLSLEVHYYMLHIFTTWNDWLTKNMFFVVLSGLFFGLFLTLSDSIMLRRTVVGLFAYMTFITALNTSLKDFITVLRKPWIPLWILFLVHFITPLTAWATGILFYPFSNKSSHSHNLVHFISTTTGNNHIPSIWKD